jgi:hypothetical protein
MLTYHFTGLLHHRQPVRQQVCERGPQGRSQWTLSYSHLVYDCLSGILLCFNFYFFCIFYVLVFHSLP